MEITATVKLTGDGKITIKSGVGIGKVTKPGLQVPVGEGAINPVPKSMITEAVKEVLPAGKGVEVTITAPEGANIAKKTMNAKLGIRRRRKHFGHDGRGETAFAGSLQTLT